MAAGSFMAPRDAFGHKTCRLGGYGEGVQLAIWNSGTLRSLSPRALPIRQALQAFFRASASSAATALDTAGNFSTLRGVNWSAPNGRAIKILSSGLGIDPGGGSEKAHDWGLLKAFPRDRSLWKDEVPSVRKTPFGNQSGCKPAPPKNPPPVGASARLLSIDPLPNKAPYSASSAPTLPVGFRENNFYS